jgi:hypothetical protein
MAVTPGPWPSDRVAPEHGALAAWRIVAVGVLL